MKMRMNSKTAGIVFLLICLLIVLFIGQFVYLGSSDSMDYILEGATGKKSNPKHPQTHIPVTARARENMSVYEGAQNKQKAQKKNIPGTTRAPRADSPNLLPTRASK